MAAEGHGPHFAPGNGGEPRLAVNGISDALVRAALDRVLSSHEFRSSRRSQEFLRYVVENTLQGRAGILKERTIGIEVFSRPTSYDPSDDATVRVKAGEVRKRLSLYYGSEGRADEVRIELPAGTYVPEFNRHDPAVDSHVVVTEAPIEPAVQVPRSRQSYWMRWLVLALVVAAGLFIWLRPRLSPAVIDQFWAPVLRGSSPVLLCVAWVPDLYAFDQGPNGHGPARIQDFVRIPDQFVGGGDLLAVSHISRLLNKFDHGYQVKIGSDVSFKDLRGSPAVLIGYSYTRWREISKELRYFIDVTRDPLMVTDNGVPTPWALPNMKVDHHTEEDYAIISRVFHPDTQSMLVEVAGITQYGTDAAADLIANPRLMDEAFQGVPDGWQRKNLQLVVHVKVISGTPVSPKVVARHFW